MTMYGARQAIFFFFGEEFTSRRRVRRLVAEGVDLSRSPQHGSQWETRRGRARPEIVQEGGCEPAWQAYSVARLPCSVFFVL